MGYNAFGGGATRVPAPAPRPDHTKPFPDTPHTMNDRETARAPGAAMLGRVVLLVRDHDEALRFYTDALGATPIHDSTAGGQRYLHVALPAQAAEGAAPVGIWFMRAEANDPALGRQAGGHPFLVLYTDDCRAAVARFAAAGGAVRQPPRAGGGATFAHVADLYGNELVMVQLGTDGGGE